MTPFRSDRRVLILMLLLPVIGFIYLGTNLAANSKKLLHSNSARNVVSKIHQDTTISSTSASKHQNTTLGLKVKTTSKSITTRKKEPVKEPPTPETVKLEKVFNDPALEDKLMAMVVYERLSGMEHGCQFSGKDYKLDVEALLTSSHRPRFYFSDKYKLLVCEVPKCGSTSWKKTLLTMDRVVNYTKPQDIPGGEAHELGSKMYLWNHFNASDPVSVAKTRERISNYTRVMTVREPLKRLVSAFKDKILPTGTGGERFGALSKRIHKKYKANDTKEDSEYASWEEFVRYLTDPNKNIYMDAHWDFFSRFCSPCIAKYDYLLKLETVYHDIKYLSNRLGFDMTPYFPASKEGNRHKKWDSEYTQYYARLSADMKEKLYKMYLNQYELFGYPRPDFL